MKSLEELLTDNQYVADSTGVEQRRLVIRMLAYRVMPEFSNQKLEIIDKMVMQCLALLERGTWTSVVDITTSFRTSAFSAIVDRTEVGKSLERLKRENKVLLDGRGYYRLPESERASIAESLQKLGRAFQEEFNSCIPDAYQNNNTYTEAFINGLSHIFSSLGATCIQVLQGTSVDRADLVQGYVPAAVAHITNGEPSLDRAVLSDAIYRFFDQPSENADVLMTYMAHGYYLCQALSVDESGHLLSRDIFGDGVFYLDTNVIVPALDPYFYENHHAFRALADDALALNIKLRCARISLVEMQRMVANERQALTRSLQAYPEETVYKNLEFGTQFRGKYFRMKRQSPTVTIDDVVKDYDNAEEKLKSDYGIEVVDSEFFDEALQDPNLERLASLVAEAHERYKRSEYSQKRGLACQHDAMLLMWVQSRRENKGEKAWLLTWDFTLPPDTGRPTKANDPLAISVPSLFQWLRSVRGVTEGQEARIRSFAELVRRLVLPPLVLPIERIGEIKALISDIALVPESILRNELPRVVEIVKRRIGAKSPNEEKECDKEIQEVIGKMRRQGYEQVISWLRLQEYASEVLRYQPDYEEQIRMERKLRKKGDEIAAAERRRADRLRIVCTCLCIVIYVLICIGLFQFLDLPSRSDAFQVVVGMLSIIGPVTGWIVYWRRSILKKWRRK